jgi:hypothetical protein
MPWTQQRQQRCASQQRTYRPLSTPHRTPGAQPQNSRGMFTPAPPRGLHDSLFSTARSMPTPATGAAVGGTTLASGAKPPPRPFAAADAASQLALPTAAPPVAPPPEAASPGIMVAFAQALEAWTLGVHEGMHDPRQVASHLPLLERYEAICDSEIGALEARLQQPSSSATLAAALASECALLRGERSTWRLLRLLYADFDARQQPPPELPAAPEDWSAELRALGGAPPPLSPDQIRARAADAAAEDGLSRGPAEAGIHVASLHDEAVLEARFVASDALLDLGLRLQGWLEHAAAERVRVREQDAAMRHTRVRLEV